MSLDCFTNLSSSLCARLDVVSQKVETFVVLLRSATSEEWRKEPQVFQNKREKENKK
jgi:hypothetical protein